jgi:glutamyl-tRNA synthetase
MTRVPIKTADTDLTFRVKEERFIRNTSMNLYQWVKHSGVSAQKKNLKLKGENFQRNIPTSRSGTSAEDLDSAEINVKLAENQPYVVRQKIPETGTTAFTDMVFGSITVENNTLDEQVLMKADGLPTYNFANVIDDHLMEISHVVRGYEYLSSAPKYNLLYESFGWKIPEYIHLPHIMREDGRKLSKREGMRHFRTCWILGTCLQQ